MMKLSAQEMLNKFSKSSLHPLEVQRLAMMIFDETNEKVHAMSDKCREYLSVASLLHDIGYHVESKNHNKHSMKMVIEHGLDGFSEIETKIIGCICRYHRGGLPDKDEHDVYNTLEKKERKAVKRLAGILKISDGLANGEKSFIENININFDKENNIVEFIIKPYAFDFLPDISSAVRKRDLYEIGFKCQSVLKIESEYITNT